MLAQSIIQHKVADLLQGYIVFTESRNEELKADRRTFCEQRKKDIPRVNESLPNIHSIEGCSTGAKSRNAPTVELWRCRYKRGYCWERLS